MVAIRWKRGGEAEIVAFDGEGVEVLSTMSSPPGSRIDGDAEIDGKDRFHFRMKVHGCSKRETRFLIKGRVLDLPRERRLVLERFFQTGTAEQVQGAESPEDPPGAG